MVDSVCALRNVGAGGGRVVLSRGRGMFGWGKHWKVATWVVVLAACRK